MTHEHDFELIAAIAEAAMSPADQAAAEASLDSCEVCRSDLALQREALAALASAPAVAMTDLERARLHRMVAQALEPPTPVSATSRSVPWFQRLVPAMAAAAALLVVVGVGSVLTGDDAADFDTAAETSAVAGEIPRDGADEEAGQVGDALEFDDMAGATSTTMAAAAPVETLVEYLGEISKADLRDEANRLASEPADGLTATDGQFESATEEPDLMCAETAAEQGEIALIRRATVEGVEIEIYRIDDRVDVYARPDCNPVDPFEW